MSDYSSISGFFARCSRDDIGDLPKDHSIKQLAVIDIPKMKNAFENLYHSIRTADKTYKESPSAGNMGYIPMKVFPMKENNRRFDFSKEKQVNVAEIRPLTTSERVWPAIKKTMIAGLYGCASSIPLSGIYNAMSDLPNVLSNPEIDKVALGMLFLASTMCGTAGVISTYGKLKEAFCAATVNKLGFAIDRNEAPMEVGYYVDRINEGHLAVYKHS